MAKGIKEFCINGHRLSETAFIHKSGGRNKRDIYRCSVCWYKQSRKRILLSRYGITPEQLEEMIISQKGMCAICKTTEVTTQRKQAHHIDHCHTTGKVRGVLCPHCNQGLGHFRDNTTILKEAIIYLENNK